VDGQKVASLADFYAIMDTVFPGAVVAITLVESNFTGHEIGKEVVPIKTVPVSNLFVKSKEYRNTFFFSGTLRKNEE
jgi:hypothetical protein